jgi:hypothetical protein
MSQTDTRPGFKLPWTAERNDAGQPGDAPGDAPSEEPGMEMTGEPAGEGAAQPADASVDVDDSTAAEEHMTTDMTDATAITAARRPTKFMADLSRAMQTAAESSRDETMTRFASDAKVAVEEIRTGSAEEAAGLRRRADDDVAAVREWSKTEIARIREETDARIVARKSALDGEMDAFAAIIEARVERVNKTVTEFEAEMSEFFERLLAEQDPTRIATMAQAMPDPPDLSAIAATVTEAAPRAVPTADPVEPDAEPVAHDDVETPAAEAPAETETQRETQTETDVQAESEPVYEAQAEGEPVAAEAPVESVEGEPEPVVMPDPDFAAAEAEAASFSGDLDDDDGLTKLAESSDAPAEAPAASPAARASGRVTTRVVVLGLVSVASIATFKRSLGRVSGVSAIGVASGPDGEFVFTVSHDAGLALGEAITALAGFDATITNQTSDGLEVAAHDPDAGD